MAANQLAKAFDRIAKLMKEDRDANYITAKTPKA